MKINTKKTNAGRSSKIGVAPTAAPAAITLDGLTKFYGKNRGIGAVSLTVEQGEFFGFIGPNGAGKSTTIRLLLGLLRATNGTAQILGMDVARKKEAILSQIGYLPAETMFYPGMRVRDVLQLSANLRRKDCIAEAAQLCDRLQLDSAKKVSELSFGNRKKVGIVCALQHNPKLLILDEPTTGLDPLMQREFFELLRARNEVGTTIFLSSHILSEIQRNCSRAAIIQAGKIIACDHVEALTKTSAKRISIHGEIDVSALTGVRDLQRTADTCSFLYSGQMQTLLASLSHGTICDLSITEPDLEEIFLHYYAKGGALQ